ncbi:MAG: group II intron reverse transcriptase/maturase, partial [Rhodoplanes sp.]
MGFLRATHLVDLVQGTQQDAEQERLELAQFLKEELRMELSMEKTHITHVDDGFVLLGHRIIRKRGANGHMSVVTTIPKEKAKAFVRK